jgi:hypothetical protein
MSPIKDGDSLGVVVYKTIVGGSIQIAREIVDDRIRRESIPNRRSNGR